MMLLLLNTNVSAIENCCKWTRITFEVKKYNKYIHIYRSNEYLQPFPFDFLFPGMTSSLAEISKSSAAHFLDAFLVILWFLDIPNYSGMFDYIKGEQPAVYFKTPKKSLRIIFKSFDWLIEMIDWWIDWLMDGLIDGWLDWFIHWVMDLLPTRHSESGWWNHALHFWTPNRAWLVGVWYTRSHRLFHISKGGGVAWRHKQLIAMPC